MPFGSGTERRVKLLEAKEAFVRELLRADLEISAHQISLQLDEKFGGRLHAFTVAQLRGQVAAERVTQLSPAAARAKQEADWDKLLKELLTLIKAKKISTLTMTSEGHVSLKKIED